MAITVKHKFVSSIPDGADATVVRPSNWNDDHDLTGTIPVANGGTGASTADGAVTNLLPSQTGNNGKVLTTDGTNTSWSTNGVGDVVGPASATDNAIARFDTTTGKLIQNSVVTVGDTGAVSGVTTLSASTSVSTPIVKATSSAGGALQNASGTNQAQWGAGGGDNFAIDVSTNLNGTNAQIDISPTGTGHVHINPSGSGSIEMNPTSAGTIDNMVIGGTTAAAGSFTNLSVTGTTSFDGSQGTAGQVLTSAGTGATPTWTTPATGTVTSVTGTAPVVSSGGATPAISMAAATTSVNGYLTSTDWTTFNGKQAALVSGTNIKTVSGTTLLGSGDLGVIGATYGGTGQSVYAIGDIVYASTTTALSKLADVATGNALISGGVGVAPSYGKIGLTTHVSGTLPVANGGTGQSSYAVGDIVYASTTTALSKLADVATGSALISGGVGVAPSYGKIGLTTHVSGTLPIANGGTNATTASITSFNNITGYTASGATGTTSTNLVFSTAPTVTNPTLTGFIETVYAATGTTPALSPTNGTIQTWTLSGSSTPTAGTWTAGASMTLQIVASTYTVTWTSLAVSWIGGSAPTLSTSGTTVIELWKVGTTVYGALVGSA